VAQLLDIANIKPGFEIAADVENASGALLLPAGVTLTEESIARLRAAGVDKVLVHVVETAEDRAAIRLDALERRFNGVTDPDLKRLKGLIRKQLSGARAS